MSNPPDASLQSSLQVLRNAFAGIVSRHDQSFSRLVVAEDAYREFIMGPVDGDWRMEHIIRTTNLTIRDVDVVFVSPEERSEILSQRPDATFRATVVGEECFYEQPGIDAHMLFRGDPANLAEFHPLAVDAGFCLIRYLHKHPVTLKLPELVPLEAIGTVRSRSTSTNTPSDLFERWVMFLHMLGWQKLARYPLRAVRSIWHGNHSFHGDPEEIHRLVGSLPMSELLRNIPLPPRYFSSQLLQDLNLASVYAIDSLLAGTIDQPVADYAQLKRELEALQPGNEDSTAYHKLVVKILSALFEPGLYNPQPEESIHEDRGRIDIVFDNAAERGYFYDLLIRHHIKCPVVFFECKNYSSDVGPPEFAQLASRLSPTRSQVGFLVCRTITDPLAALNRCKDQFNSRKDHILVLHDQDLHTLLDFKSQNDEAGIRRYLNDKWRLVFMDQAPP